MQKHLTASNVLNLFSASLKGISQVLLIENAITGLIGS